MSNDEILDKVDEKGSIIGQAPRSVFHSDPSIIHAVVHCWIFNPKGEILWQQRSHKKVQAPGQWDMSSGGHILSGEKPKETLRRELNEELGLTDVDYELVEKYVQRHETQTEFVYLYYAIIDKDNTDLKLQKEEVEQVQWIEPSKAQQLVLDGKIDSTDFIFTQITKILRFMSIKKGLFKQD